MNQRADPGNHKQHQSAQIIEDERERNIEHAADVDPYELRRGDVHLGEDCATAGETSENGRDRDGTADIFPAARDQSDDTSRTEWQEQGEPRKQAVGGESQNRKVRMSSTCVVCRRRKSATAIASPTATSAAATVMMKKTKTCAL